MDFRLAVPEDLPQLRSVYKDIIRNMNDNGIQIWDDIYPCEFFDEDIKRRRLYVLYDNAVLVSAFALCDTNSGEKAVRWKNNHGKALYLDRFGVNAAYSGKGIGCFMLGKAKETAKNSGAEYLRLFVVDINKPALCLYIKNGFTKSDGVYNEIIGGDIVLHEYGYEAAL